MSDTILTITMTELCQSQSITQELIVEIVEYGIAEPIKGSQQHEWVFDPSAVHWLKKAIRLNRELEIDWVAVAMVIALMRQKEDLQRENTNLHQLLDRLS
jgi:chaperone modulatory protein CbpM